MQMKPKKGVTADDIVRTLEAARDESRSMADFCKSIGNRESAAAFLHEVKFAECILQEVAE